MIFRTKKWIRTPLNPTKNPKYQYSVDLQAFGFRFLLLFFYWIDMKILPNVKEMQSFESKFSLQQEPFCLFIESIPSNFICLMQIYSESYRLIGSEIQMQNILAWRSYLFFIILHLFFVLLSLFIPIVMPSRGKTILEKYLPFDL